MQNNAIYMSIKPKFVSLIETKEKNYEFRKYIPKRIFKYIYLYTSLPVGELKYIIEVDKIINSHQKIMEKGYGNEEFNLGQKKSKYAYHIKHLYQLNKPLSLEELKKKYKFIATQGYYYAEHNELLTNYINKTSKKLLF